MENKEEITLKQLFLTIKKWLKYLRSKWIAIGIAAVVCGLALMIYAWRYKPTYTATLTFVLSSSSSNPGGLAGLASQFGLDFSSSGNDAFTSENIVSLMNSKTMVQKALLKKPEGSNMSLVNIFIKQERINEGWDNLQRTKGAFPFPDDTAKLTLVQDSLFRSLYKYITKKVLTVAPSNESKSIYVVSTTSHNELFSLNLTKYLVDATSKFYISTKTSVAQQNLNMIQGQADSLRKLLSSSIASSLHNYDQTYNLNPAYQSQRFSAQDNQVNTTAVGQAYGEVLKNLELAKITLLKETPLYQIIDEPGFPLIKERKSRLLSLIAGGILGAVLMSALLITKKALF